MACPPPKPTTYSRQGRPRRTSIFCTAFFPTLTRLCWDSLLAHLPQGTKAKRSKKSKNPT